MRVVVSKVSAAVGAAAGVAIVADDLLREAGPSGAPLGHLAPLGTAAVLFWQSGL